ncbi:MAG: NapC/NirT family cytochrome c [Acidobacteriia bacterium]|nr:NapC/NirT family cytochrome c [Terriglobia bacterium]
MRALSIMLVGCAALLYVFIARAEQPLHLSWIPAMQGSTPAPQTKPEDQKTPPPNAAAAPGRQALPEPKDLQLLKDMPMPQVIQQMRAMAAALGVECSYCHVNPFSQLTPRKSTARLMLRDYVMGLKHKDGTALTCNDCHMGQANFLRSRPFENAVNTANSHRQLKTITRDNMLDVMNAFSKALGVKCDYCHTSDPEEETPRKQIARFMFAQFTQGLVKKDGSAITCMDCHQGHARPLTVLPFPRPQRSGARPAAAGESKKSEG